MKWLGRRQSGNVDDRRGFSGGGLLAGGGIGGLIIYLIVNFFFGGDTAGLVQGGGYEQRPASNGVVEGQDPASDEMAKFSSVVLAETEDVWNKLFTDLGRDYQEPMMVLFSGQTGSGCGGASSATGPFYCPADQRVYLDLSFFNDLKERFGAAGDFANAYVIAHEVGHHVQYLLGTSEKVQSARERLGEKEGNKLSVAMELQADFFAGVWAHHTQKMKGILEEGDIEEALNAASAIGDDRLQKMGNGRVVPDAFTHGTSAQRSHWFRLGYTTGDLNQGNTFASN